MRKKLSDRDSMSNISELSSKYGKKSQAAMEFLITYGWAILVVLIAISALAYFGLLNPDIFLPEYCTLPAGMDCMDASITYNPYEPPEVEGMPGTPPTNTIEFALINNRGYPIELVKITMPGDVTEQAEESNSIDNNQVFTVKFEGYEHPTEGAYLQGSKLKVKFKVTYTNSKTGLTHTEEGSLRTKVS